MRRRYPVVMPLRRQRSPPADALAYNLGNFMRTLAIPATAEPWSLTSLREKLKIGAEVVSHGPYLTFQMTEVAVPRQMYADRPAAGAAGSSMKGLRGLKARAKMGDAS
jgi:hypothetical protein